MTPASTDTDPGTPSLQVANGVARVSLRRPAQRNSLREADLQTLLGHFARIDADVSVRVAVLDADTQGQARPVFCAGYDVGGFEDNLHGPRLFERVADALAALRPVSLCAMGGSVYGGATDLALACDLRVGLAGCEWRMPACALGLHYYPNGLQRYVARFGLPLAQRAFLGGGALTVEELAAAGLFERVATAEAFDTAVESLVQRVALLAPLAAQATKRSLREIADGRFDEAALREREAMCQASADFAEGRAAMAERRAPRFSGR